MAATIRVLSSGAPQTGVEGCIEAYRRDSGNNVEAEYATAPEVRRRIEAGADGFDIVIAPVEAVAGFSAAGRMVAGTDAVIGGVKAAVVVRDGAPMPDISTAGTLKQAILDAESIVYNEASSGIYIARMMETLGIAEAVENKTVRGASAEAIMAHLAAGTAASEIGFGQSSAIRRFADKGVTMVGPLPKEVEHVTTYAAALVAASREEEAARAFIRFMTGAQGTEIFAAAGIE